jgi:hypothetical protein
MVVGGKWNGAPFCVPHGEEEQRGLVGRRTGLNARLVCMAVIEPPQK